MEWKVRKDKRKAAEPDAPVESQPSNGEGDAQAAESAPVFDLSGDAFRSTPPDAETPPSSANGADSAENAPIALGSDSAVSGDDPIALAPLPDAASQPEQSLPSSEEYQVPRFDLGDHDIDEPRFDVSPERESIAPGLVSTESDTGLPKVAPFIVDVDRPEKPQSEDGTHSVVVRIGKLSADYSLVKNVTTIGRPDSIVQNYPDIEIEMDDSVSRRHAEIRRHADQYVIVDVGSTNGTILNGEKLTPNEESPLRSGDRMRIGERTELIFE